MYQAACDTLAGYYLSVCDRDAALYWYDEELSARKRQITPNRRTAMVASAR